MKTVSGPAWIWEGFVLMSRQYPVAAFYTGMFTARFLHLVLHFSSPSHLTLKRQDFFPKRPRNKSCAVHLQCNPSPALEPTASLGHMLQLSRTKENRAQYCCTIKWFLTLGYHWVIPGRPRGRQFRFPTTLFWWSSDRKNAAFLQSHKRYGSLKRLKF